MQLPTLVFGMLDPLAKVKLSFVLFIILNLIFILSSMVWLLRLISPVEGCTT